MMVLEVFKQYFALYLSISIIVFFMYSVINTFRFLDTVSSIVVKKIKKLEDKDADR